jgi:hypothetical protein
LFLNNDDRAAGQIAYVGGPYEPVGCPLQTTTESKPLVIETTIQLRCERGSIETLVIRHRGCISGVLCAATESARPMTGSESNCFVKEEEWCPSAWCGERVLPVPKTGHANDPK